MTVSMEKTGNVSGIITVSLTQEDYQDKVNKDLKAIGQKHPVHGFRAGKVPMGILKKLYGKQVLADVINRQTVDALFKYIEDNKLAVLGEPLSANEAKEIDFDATEYTFSFEVGLAPEFEVKVDKDMTIPYYTIKVDDEMVKRQDDAFLRRFGSQVPGEEVDETALVKGSVVELAKEDGISTEKTIISMEYISADEKAKFIGKKVGDKVVFNPKAAANDNAAELASMLNIEKEAAEAIEGDFEFTINEIIVLKLAEKNQDYFNQVFGEDKVHNEEEYANALREMIANQLMLDSNYRFTIDAENAMKTAAGELEMPAEFLKKWLVKTNNNITEENVNEEYDRMMPSAQMQLIKEKIVENFGIKVEEEDLKREAKLLAAQQFAQYGMHNVPEEYIEKFAQDFLDKKEYRQNLLGKAVDNKLFAAVKEAVTIDNKEVTVDEFNKLFA